MINLYMNNPTAGQKNGTLISQDMAQTSPLSITLKAGEVKAVKVAVRCDSGYQADEAAISFNYYNGSGYEVSGGNMNKWKIAVDDGYTSEADALDNGNWASSIKINNVADTNKLFWVKFEAGENDTPENDNHVGICVKATVEAVA